MDEKQQQNPDNDDSHLEEQVADDIVESSDSGDTPVKGDSPSTESDTDDTTSNSPEPETKVDDKSKTHSLNKYFLYTLVAGLVISALISVVAVLIGEFNSTMSHALGTTVSMVLHTFVALFLVSLLNRKKDTDNSVIVNTLVVLTITSFITSILGIWGVISSRVAGDLYLLHFYSFAIVLWVQLLRMISRERSDKPTRIASFVAIGFSVLFYALLIPTIFVHYPDRLPEFYYRVLAATVILLATTSVLTTVLRRIYIFKHPASRTLPTIKSGWDIAVAIIVLAVGVPIIIFLMAMLSSYNSYTNSPYDDRTASESPAPNKYSAEKDMDAEADCSLIAPYKNLVREYDKVKVMSIDLQGKMMQSKTDYDSPLSYEWETEPKAVDKGCLLTPITDIKAGDDVRVYWSSDIYTNVRETRLIQKLQ